MEYTIDKTHNKTTKIYQKLVHIPFLPATLYEIAHRHKMANRVDSDILNLQRLELDALKFKFLSSLIYEIIT